MNEEGVAIMCKAMEDIAMYTELTLEEVEKITMEKKSA